MKFRNKESLIEELIQWEKNCDNKEEKTYFFDAFYEFLKNKVEENDFEIKILSKETGNETDKDGYKFYKGVLINCRGFGKGEDYNYLTFSDLDENNCDVNGFNVDDKINIITGDKFGEDGLDYRHFDSCDYNHKTHSYVDEEGFDVNGNKIIDGEIVDTLY